MCVFWVRFFYFEWQIQQHLFLFLRKKSRANARCVRLCSFVRPLAACAPAFARESEWCFCCFFVHRCVSGFNLGSITEFQTSKSYDDDDAAAAITIVVVHSPLHCGFYCYCCLPFNFLFLSLPLDSHCLMRSGFWITILCLPFAYFDWNSHVHSK